MVERNFSIKHIALHVFFWMMLYAIWSYLRSPDYRTPEIALPITLVPRVAASSTSALSSAPWGLPTVSSTAQPRAPSIPRPKCSPVNWVRATFASTPSIRVWSKPKVWTASANRYPQKGLPQISPSIRCHATGSLQI